MMRRELAWALVACLSLSVWALLDPLSRSESGVVVPAAVAPSATSDAGTTGASGATANAASLQPSLVATLPESWPMHLLDAADRNPFVSPVTQRIATPAARVPVALQAPTAPTVAYRFWGALTTPSGEQLLYVTRDDNQAQPISVQVGTRLEGGFQVEQINAGAIVLAQAGSERRMTLSMAPPGAAGVR